MEGNGVENGDAEGGNIGVSGGHRGGNGDNNTHGSFSMQGLGKCLTGCADEGSIESQRYYLARRTVLEMLRDRGYSVLSSEVSMSIQEFRAIHGSHPDPDRLKVSAPYRSDPSKRIAVVFCGPVMVKVNTIRMITAQIANKDSLAGLMLVVEKHITSQAQTALGLFSFKVEIFQITDLLVNITKHVLKPRHRVLTEREKQSLLKKYNIDEKQLPRLLKKDAIARYYGLEKGQVVKVTYGGEITGVHVTYRCVW